MNININKRKAMLIERKQKKIEIRLKDESVEQVDSFKCLRYNVGSNMNCCQEVKPKIAMAKEAFNSKIRIFCGLLEKELSKKLAKCFVKCVIWCYGKRSF